MECKCGGNSVKRGLRATALGPKQMYLCTKCGKKFTPEWPRMRFPRTEVMHAVRMYNSGMSTSAVQKAMHDQGISVSRWTIIKWHRKFGKK